MGHIADFPADSSQQLSRFLQASARAELGSYYLALVDMPRRAQRRRGQASITRPGKQSQHSFLCLTESPTGAKFTSKLADTGIHGDWQTHKLSLFLPLMCQSPSLVCCQAAAACRSASPCPSVSLPTLILSTAPYSILIIVSFPFSSRPPPYTFSVLFLFLSERVHPS